MHRATISALDDVGSVGSYPSIAIGINGNPIVSYHDATHGVLKVAACGNATCHNY